MSVVKFNKFTPSRFLSENRAGQQAGCGIDAEKIARFSTLLFAGEHPFPFVFSAAEITHAHSLENPAIGLCAAFCCKEALFKAIGMPYNYPDCQLFFNPAEIRQQVCIETAFASEFGIAYVDAQVMPSAAYDELVIGIVIRSHII